MKICVYAIAKNEAHFVSRFMESCAGADRVLIVDTGSDDQTVDCALAQGATVYAVSIKPWRFDDARNAALALVPDDIDVCISLDMDEVLTPGWREAIEHVWTPETTRLRYLYEWEQGRVFNYEKIHARHGYRWKHPVHEVPVIDARGVEVWATTEKLLVRHFPDATKSRASYLGLLQLSVAEDTTCPRNAFYLAREYAFNGLWAAAEQALATYLALPGATWPVERAYAMRLMAIARDAAGDKAGAMQWLCMAAAEAPGVREAWCALALMTYQDADWTYCLGTAYKALAITAPLPVYMTEPFCWGSLPHDLASVAAWNLGLRKIAIEQARLAVEKSPNDARLVNNLRLVIGEPNEANIQAA